MKHTKGGCGVGSNGRLALAFGALLASGVAVAACDDEDQMPIDLDVPARDAAADATVRDAGAAVDVAAVDVRGKYVGNLVNGANSCPGDWKVGDTTQVTVDVTQTGSTVGAEVTGVTGLFLDLALGSHTFSGTAQGDALSLTLRGTNEESQGDCKYTWRADFTGRITGNTLAGEITYRPQPGGQTACATMNVTTCSRVQSFNGVRPAAP